MNQVELVAKNQWGFYDFFGHSPTHQMNKEGYWHWLRAQVAIWPSYFTYAFKPGAEFPKLLQGMEESRLPRQVWLDVLPQFAHLENGLVAQGAELLAQYPGMFADLSPLVPQALQGLEILPVNSEDMLEEWSTVIIKGWWGGGQDRIDTLCQVYRHLYQRPEMTLRVARVEGAVLGTALSFRTGETIGLYMITVMPQFRGKGYGYQLTLQPMLTAREQGCRHGALYATPEGRRVYEMLGFRDVTQARIYYLPEPKEGS